MTGKSPMRRLPWRAIDLLDLWMCLQKSLKGVKVQIEFITPHEGLIAFASLVINDCLKLSSIAVHKKLNAEGYRITYPSKGKFNIFGYAEARRPLVHPINKEASDAIEAAIFQELKTVINEGSNNDVYVRHSKNTSSL